MSALSLKRKIYLLLEAHDHESDLSESERVYWERGKKIDFWMQWFILLNVITFVLETVKSFNQQWGVLFNTVEYISVVIFTLEYIMRVYCITEAEQYAHPLWGRLQYIRSPLAVVDLLAFLPAYIPLIYQDFRFIRVFRLFRLFRLLKLWRYSSSLRMLIKVILEKKSDLQVIFFTIIILIVVSASLMFLIENEAQPDSFASIPHTMWWSVATLTTVGYGDMYPKTEWGKILGSFIALLGVGLIALPAGIISAGFVQEINRVIRFQTSEENAEKIRKAFHTSSWVVGDSKATHRALDLITIKSRLQLSEEDIFDAIQRQSGFRVRYKKNTKYERFANTLVLEHFDFNRSYGCYLNRASDLAIISPMSHAEHSIGHFTAHLAKYVAADYVSNEMYGEDHDLNVDFAFSFSKNIAYNETESPVPSAFLDFKKDIREVIHPHEVVFICKSSPNRFEDFILHFGGKLDQDGFEIEESTFRNMILLKNFYDKLQKNFKKENLNFTFATHKYLDNTSTDSIHQYIANSTHASVVTMYINNDLMEWSDDDTYYRIIKILGDTLLNFFGT
jgi:voltage-gated potassium channel